MVSQIKTVGQTQSGGFSSLAKRAILVASDGTPVAVYCDVNNAGATGGDGTGIAKIYVYTGNSTRTTWTLRATITPTTALRLSPILFTANLFADNSIGIAWINTSDAIAYRKVTTGTWAVSAEETVGASVGGTTPRFNEIDLSVSAGGAVLVIAHYSHNTAGDYSGYRLYLRRTTPNTWAQVDSASINTSSAHNANTQDVSCVWIQGGTTTARNYAISYAGATTSSDAHGVKMKVGKLDETAGAAVTGSTLVGTFAANDAFTLATSFSMWARRTFLFSSATNEVTYGIMSWLNGVKLHVGRFTYNGTTLATTIADTTYSSTATVYGQNGLSMTYSNGVLDFFHAGNSGGIAHPTTYSARISGGVVTYSGKRYWNNLAPPNGDTLGAIMAGTGVNTGFAKPDLMVHSRSGSAWSLWCQPVEALQTPTKAYPAGGSAEFTSEPNIGIAPYPARVQPQSDWKFIWQFASDAAFTTNVVTYTQPDSMYQKVGAPSGSLSTNMAYTLWDVLPLANSLTQRIWYLRATKIDIWGNQYPWTPTSQFVVTHTPSAAAVSPVNGETVFYGAGNVLFSWTFSDPYPNDSQSAYQIIIERVDTGAVITDTGKVASTVESASVVVSGSLQDVTLRWRVRTWDADDVPGLYSTDATFIVSTPPTVVITSPATGTPVATPNPTTSFTVDTSGGRTITRYRVIYSQGNVVLYDSSWQYGSWADAASISHPMPSSILANNQPYTVQVRVTDEWDLEGRQSIAVATQWTPPAAPTGQAVNIGSYNVQGAGYITVTWSDTGRDADFIKWKVYRKDDLIDPNTLAVLEAGTFKEIGVDYDASLATHTYRDFYAPAGYSVTYQVTQTANRFGTEAESTLGAGISNTPKSDGYWLIDPTETDFTQVAVRLSIVTADSFTNEYEEEVVHLLGRGRYVDRGDHLGYSGSLSAQLRDDLTQSARQKRFKLESLKEQNISLYLRNPFGDMFRVSVGNVQTNRLAGVGTSEFVDVSFTYLEVVE